MNREPHLVSGWITPELWKQFEKEKTSIHRIYSSKPVYIERYGSDLLISRYSNLSVEPLLEELAEWKTKVGYEPARIFRRDMVKNPDGTEHSPLLLSGAQDQPGPTSCSEQGILYEVDVMAGYSTGFFMDQRNNRAKLRKLRPRKLLNCFSYTCSFSLVAAMEGGHTTSIDLSQKALERGRANFSINRIDPGKHDFIAGEVMDRLQRFARKKTIFDAIILDPPTFSRSKGGAVFQAEKDYGELIYHALRCAADNAAILLSTNCRSLNTSNLIDQARMALRRVKREAMFEDAPLAPDIPEESMPSTAWMILQD